MPVWLAIALGLMGVHQQSQAQSAQERALARLDQPLSEEEVAAHRSSAQSTLKADLSRRGVLDSDLYTGGISRIEKDLALARVKGRSAMSGTYAQALLNKSNQPTMISSLIPMMLQYGLRGGGDNWLINPMPRYGT